MKFELEQDQEDSTSEDAEFIAKIEQDFKDEKSEALDYWNPKYEHCKKRMRFTLLGHQFDEGEGKRMGFDYFEEPNLLLTYLNHEANTTLQTDYMPKISPNGGGVNDIQARAREEVLRGLQRKNDLSQVLNQARRMQCAAGIYFTWTNTPYAMRKGFGKTILVEGIEQTFNVYPDPYVKYPTCKDARRWFYKQDIPKSQWKEETGLDDEGDWSGKKTKEIWHYFVREDNKDKEYLGDDDSSMLESELPDDEETGEKDLQGVAHNDDGPIYRDINDTKWCWYKFAEERLIDSEELEGSESPFTCCMGRKVVDGEKVEIQSLTQFAEVPQKGYTILHNLIKLRLGRSPYSKWKFAFESVLSATQLQTLRDSAVMGDTDIPYKAFDERGQPIPAPEEVQPYILDPVLLTLKQDCEIQIQKIFGIWEANLGQKSNEQSGIAIEARAKGGETSNFDLNFNFTEFVEQIGRSELDLIPKVLTPEQQLKFIDQTDRDVVQWIMQNGSTDGDEEYSLSIEAMPTAKTARQEEAENLSNLAAKVPLIQNNPQAMGVVLAAQPGRHSQELSDIIKGSDPRIKQMQMQMQQLQGKLQQTTQQAQTKMQQDALKQQGLQTTVQSLRAQMQLMTKAHQAQNAGNSGDTVNPMADMLEVRLKELELQVEQFNAESTRMDSETNRIKVLGSLAQPPEPPTPQPGQGLP